jgi:putative SOS response-associated peptidase YedK
MCGRFTLLALPPIAERFGLHLFADDERLVPRFNIAPSDSIVTVVHEFDERRTLRFMRWGFSPGWLKPRPGRPVPINARAETLLDRVMFRDAVARNRCLIPADGFYEWQAVPGQRGKRPMYIRLKGGGLFAFAGLYTKRRDASTGEPEQSCAIVTTEPNALTAPIHNRMPVILAREDEELWLDPTLTDRIAVLACLRPYPPELMEAYPVSNLVNSVRNDRPELIEPAA